MEFETIQLPKQLIDSIRETIKKTNLFADETDFINQAIIKQISKLNKEN
jgi:Arc/MetJ-type ribon-helix-helix transcriptional regulator